MYRVTNFGSSSNGNCTLVEDSNTCILIDAGIRYQTLIEQLKMLDISLEKIQAILITHEHGDHLSEITGLCNNHNIEVYVQKGLYEYVTTSDVLTGSLKQLKKVHRRLIKKFVPGNNFRIGTLLVLPFEVPHDTVTDSSIGYYITNPLNENLCYITDTGKVSHITLKKIDILLIESNYDHRVIDYKIKTNTIHPKVAERLTSDKGHLSLVQTCNFIEKHNDKLKKVMILHYSKLNINYESLRKEIQSIANSDVRFADASAITIIEYQDQIQKRSLI